MITRKQLIEAIVEAVIQDRRFQGKLAGVHRSAAGKTKFHHRGKSYATKRKGDTTMAYRSHLGGLVKRRVGSIGAS